MKRWVTKSLGILGMIGVGLGIAGYQAFQDDEKLLMPLNQIPRPSQAYLEAPENGYDELYAFCEAQGDLDKLYKAVDESIAARNIEDKQALKTLKKIGHNLGTWEFVENFPEVVKADLAGKESTLAEFLDFNGFDYFAETATIENAEDYFGRDLIQIRGLARDVNHAGVLNIMNGNREQGIDQLLTLAELLNKLDVNMMTGRMTKSVHLKETIDNLAICLKRDELSEVQKGRFKAILANRPKPVNEMKHLWMSEYAVVCWALLTTSDLGEGGYHIKKEITGNLFLKPNRTANMYYEFIERKLASFESGQPMSEAWRDFPETYPGSQLDKWTNKLGLSLLNITPGAFDHYFTKFMQLEASYQALENQLN